MRHLILGAIIVKSLGSLLFVLDSSVGAIVLLLHQAIAAPIFYDFYKYDADWKQFAQLFVQFTQKCSIASRSRETMEPDLVEKGMRFPFFHYLWSVSSMSSHGHRWTCIVIITSIH